MQIFEATGSLRKLSRTKSQTVVGTAYGITYQLQSIDPLILPGILSNISIWQPRVDNAEWELLRNSKEGLHIWVRDVLPPYDLVVEPLIGIRLKSLPHHNRELPHTRLTLSILAAFWSRKAFTHTRFSSCCPFQVPANPPQAYGAVSLSVTPGSEYDFGRKP